METLTYVADGQQPAMAPTTPRRSIEPYDHAKSPPQITPRSLIERPLSEATEFIDSDIDDDDDSSVFEEDSEQSAGSSYSMDSRRQSQTTISSYGVSTPRSSRNRPFEIMIKPVEGPRGPHLFRNSRSSVDFTFDSALQMSPIVSKNVDSFTRSGSAFSEATVQTAVPPRFTQSPPPMRPELQRSLSYDPSEWSIQQVTEYMGRSEVAHEIITKLEQHDINGAVLMHMQFDDLKELDIPSFGKRHQLWSVIQALKGSETGPTPEPTPFQDVTRPCTNVRTRSDGDIPYSPCSENPCSPITTPVSCSGPKKRKNKKHRRARGEIEPGESVSIVAIEQVIPKAHECSKGEECPTWRKRERLLAAIRKEQSGGGTGWPISPSRGGHIMITGNPGNASTAENLLSNVHRDQSEHRPMSEMAPSVVASSDLLGPSQLPGFALHAGMLQQLEQRDPQENVKHFLNFQHVSHEHDQEPSNPPLDMFPEEHYHTYGGRAPHELARSIERPGSVPVLGRLPVTPTPQSLPKLLIPRSASANPYSGNSYKTMASNDNTMFAYRVGATSPNPHPTPVYHNIGMNQSGKARPGSEMDVPVTAVPKGPIARDTSQSVPPDMQYRDPISLQRSNSRAEWRRPSFAMPKLDENQVFSAVSTVPPTFPVPNRQQQKAQEKELMRAEFGTSVSHAGWMKKRKAKLLRHDWQDAHFRLHGTQLDMHESNRLSAALVDTIDVDEYSITVSALASNSKISSALKSLKISGNATDKRRDAATGGAFVFQLIPGDKDRAKFATGKTHHFAVKNTNDRIDWMRELMLAKAKKQKDNGYTVEHNGEQA